MRFILSLCILAAGLALALAFPAHAAEEGAFERALVEEAGLQPQASFPGVKNMAWQAHLVYPAARLTLVAHCPQGFGEGPDAVLASVAKEPFNEVLAAFHSFADEMDEEVRAETSKALTTGAALPEPNLSDAWYANTIYSVFRPSNRYVSVLFNHHEYTGGAHGNSTYLALTFDVTTGARLALGDVFADEQAALALLVPRIADGVQAQKDADAAPVDRDPAAVDADMNRIVLVPEGARVYYAPYEMGSYAEGEFIVELGKEELIKKGARAELWR